MFNSTTGDGSCGFWALRQASQRAAIPVNIRSNILIKDVNIYYKTEGATQIAWVENILRNSSPTADIQTLRMYVNWLKIRDVREPGHTDRAWYAQYHRGVNGWMDANNCHSLALTLPYIGLFAIVGSAILHKAKYLFHTNSKIKHHDKYPGSVLLKLAE